MELVSRALAKERGLVRYFTGKQCKNGHIAERYTSTGQCLACHGKWTQQWAEDNPEGVLEKNRKWWRENKDRGRYYTARRDAAQLQRTPSWLTPEDHAEIKRIYATCPKGYHVDHIIPLQGENVSGLHVPSNLQHLSASENSRKKNHYADEGEHTCQSASTM